MMMYADDIVICIERLKGEIYRHGSFPWERGVKVSCSEMECMCANERKPCIMLRSLLR